MSQSKFNNNINSWLHSHWLFLQVLFFIFLGETDKPFLSYSTHFPELVVCAGNLSDRIRWRTNTVQGECLLQRSLTLNLHYLQLRLLHDSLVTIFPNPSWFFYDGKFELTTAWLLLYFGIITITHRYNDLEQNIWTSLKLLLGNMIYFNSMYFVGIQLITKTLRVWTFS